MLCGVHLHLRPRDSRSLVWLTQATITFPQPQISENELITKAAYILFYHARDDNDVSAAACAAPDLSQPAVAKPADSGVHYAGDADDMMADISEDEVDISEDEVAKALAIMDELD